MGVNNARLISLLKRIKRNAAGIDCGSEAHHVAVPPERDPESIRTCPQKEQTVAQDGELSAQGTACHTI